MIKRLINPEKIKEIKIKKEQKNILIEKLKLAGCSEEEIKKLTESK